MPMGCRVRVLNTSHVQPAEPTHASSWAPHHAGDHKLSFLDVIHIAVIPIQRIFFFDGGPDLPPFPSLVSTLKASLAATLAVFIPLAGKLDFRRSSGSGDVVIDCSPDAVSSGVEFVEAEYSGDASDMRRLASDEEHDTDAFMQLVPHIDLRQLPASVLAVQVTRPAAAAAADGSRGGPVAVGVSILHAAVDGHAVWQFMRAWSTASRHGSLAAPAAGHQLVPPTLDRAVVRHPNSDELLRSFLRFFAPALPLLRSPSSSFIEVAYQSRRTFLLSKKEIQYLKRYITHSQTMMNGIANGHRPKPPTTYVVVSSLVWTSIVRAHKSLNHADEAYFMVTADCRRRLRPPLDDGFFGNCVKPCFAKANVGDLREEADGLAHAAAAIQWCIRKSLEEMEDPLSDIACSVEVYREVSQGSGRLTVVGSSHRFMAYETDFGWGAPSRVELVSMFSREMVALLGTRDGNMQVSVALERARMEAFTANFVVPTNYPH